METSKSKTINPQYIILMLLADGLIAIGVVAHFLPDLLAPAGEELVSWIHDNWYWVIAMGIVAGIVNFLLHRFGRDRS